MPLVRIILKANRRVVMSLTGLFYILGCVLMLFFGLAATSPEPILFKPEIPLWEAQFFQWGGFLAAISFCVDTADQIVSHIVEKVRVRHGKNALH